ncbi:hypothetical protein QTP88_011235 [Uroleucon formosanum]
MKLMMTILLLFLPKDSNHGPNAENTYEIDVHDENTTTLCEEQSPVSNLDNNGINTEVIDEINIHEPPKKKTRIEEKYLKDHGVEYNNRKGVTIPQNKFKELINCCRRKCDIVCPPDKQKIIFEGFYKLEKEIQYQIMSCGITLNDKKSTRLGRGKYGISHDRLVTVLYVIQIENQNITVCKKMFQSVYGAPRGKIDLLIQKKKFSDSGTLQQHDNRGHHEPQNKMTEVKEEMRNHIEKYPKYQSHYSRRHTNTFYLQCHLNIKKLYEEYKLEKNGNKYGSYDLFKEVFNKTGYKFKKPKLDTCKTCDTYVLQIKQSKDIQQKILLQQPETHKKLADLGYMQNKEDKINALASNNIRVLVFHLEQVLDTPALCTNVSFYKRLLSTFNLTIRDCSENEGTECYMWHEAIGGRGSNEIASCLYQKILNLLNNVTHIITYSDKCGGQNRNINMAAMLSLVTANSSTLHIIDQKFLLPGHTHLECDVDHTKIERAKKFSDIPIMIPRDWYQFVRTVKGKKPFQVIEMKQEQFFSFSNLVSTSLTKKTVDTDGNKVNWFHIR